MRPYYQDEWLTVFHGDCLEVMAAMEPESVHCVVTSPPFWGLRDYGVDGQLGLEPTPEEYVANLVAVFQEVRRVLRKDGTVWLNLGDSYTANPGSGQARGESAFSSKNGTYDASDEGRGGKAWRGLPGKNLVGIPWRVAFALQADGWYLRSDIIWAKPNPMPESVTDRPTKSHEYIFLLSKSPRYYFDADAVRESLTGHRDNTQPTARPGNIKQHYHEQQTSEREWRLNPAGRNIRSVWTMATQPYPGSHFATFPESLPERCIKAGTSEKGVCPECGAPWERVVEKGESDYERLGNTRSERNDHPPGSYGNTRTANGTVPSLRAAARTEMGWRPSCAHVLEPVPARVLDCFAGSGTTGMVAQSLSRRAVLIDLSLDYLDQLMARNSDIPLGLTS